MNDLIAFQFEDNQEIRTVNIDGEPWFIAKDVCDILEHTNSRRAIEMLDDDEKGVTKCYTLGGEQEMNIVNESGLYNLIFRSNKQEAKIFRKWVTSEVLPTIRRKSFYAMPNLIERIENIIDRQSNLLDDPKKTAFDELETFVQKNLQVDEKRIYKVPVWHIYHAYTKTANHQLNQHEFMFKIALEHPEFELRYIRKELAFVRCYAPHFM